MKQIILFALLVIAASAQKTASKAEPETSRPSRGSRKFNTANVNDELGISSRSSFWNPDGDKQEKKVLSASERATLASQRRSHQQAKPRQTIQKITDTEPVAASSVVAPVITQQHFLSRREKATRRSDSIVPEEDAEAQPTFPSRRRPTAADETPRPDSSSRRRPPAPVSESVADTPVPPRRAGSRRPSASRSAPAEEELPQSRQRGGRRPTSRQRTEVRSRPITTETSAPSPLTTEAAPPPAVEAFETLETVSSEPVLPVAPELPQPDAAPVVTELSVTETELVRSSEVSSTTVKPTTPAQTPAASQEDTESRYQGRRGGSGRNRGAQEAKTSRRLPQQSRSNTDSADEVTPPPAAFSRTGRRNGPASTAAPQADSKRRPYRPADAAVETPTEPKRRPFRPAPAAVENDVPPLAQEFKRRPTARPVDNTEPNDVPPTLTDVRRRPSNRPAGSVEAPQGVDAEPRRPAPRTRPVPTTRGGRRSESPAPAETAEGTTVQRTSRKINADTSPRGSYKQSRRSGVSKLKTASRPSVSNDDIDEDANYPPEFIKALKLTEDTKVKESSTKSSSQDADETFVTKSSHTVSSVSILHQSLSEDLQGTDGNSNKNTNEDVANKGNARKRTNKYSRQNRPSRQQQNEEDDTDHKVKKLDLLLAPSPPSENKEEEESTKGSNIKTLRDRYKPSGSYTLRGSKSIRGGDERKQANKGESTTLSVQELPVPSSTPVTRNPIVSLQAKQGFRFKNLRVSKPKEENDNTATSTTEGQVTQAIKTVRKSLFPSTTQSNFVSRKRFSSFKRSQESNTVTIKPTEYSEFSTRRYKTRSTTSRSTSSFRRSAIATTEVITGDLLPATKLPLTPSSLLGSQKYSARFRSDLLLATGGLRSTSTPAYVPTVPLIRTSTTSETLSTENSSEALTLDLISLTVTTTPQIPSDGAKESDNNISTNTLPSIQNNLFGVDVMTDKPSLDDQTLAFINLNETTTIVSITNFTPRNNSIKNVFPNSSSFNELSVTDGNNNVKAKLTEVQVNQNASERFIDKIKPEISSTISSTTLMMNFENATEIETKITTASPIQKSYTSSKTMVPLTNMTSNIIISEHDTQLTEVSEMSIGTNNISSTVSPTRSKLMLPSISTEYKTSTLLQNNSIFYNTSKKDNTAKSTEIKDTTIVNTEMNGNYSVVSLNFTLITPNNIKNHFISLRSNDSQILSPNNSLSLASRALISNSNNNVQRVTNKSKTTLSTTVRPLTTPLSTKPNTKSTTKTKGPINSQDSTLLTTVRPLTTPLSTKPNTKSTTKTKGPINSQDSTLSTTVRPLTTPLSTKPNTKSTTKTQGTINSQDTKGTTTYSPPSSDKLQIPLVNQSNKSTKGKDILQIKNNVSSSLTSTQTSKLNVSINFQQQVSKLNNVTQINSNTQSSQEITKTHTSLASSNNNNKLPLPNAIIKKSEQIPAQEILKTHSSEVKFVAIDRPPLESDSLITENITNTSPVTEVIRNSTNSSLLTDIPNVSKGAVVSEKLNQLNLSDSTLRPETETLPNSRFTVRLTVAPRTTFTTTTSNPLKEQGLYNNKPELTFSQLQTKDRDIVHEKSKNQPEMLETTTISATPLPFVIFGIFPNNTVFRKYPHTGRIEQVNENEISRHQQYYPSETTSEKQYATSSTPDPIANEILYRNTIRNSIQTSLPQATVNTKPNVGQDTSENEVLRTLGSSSISNNQELSQRSSMPSSNEISSTSQYSTSSTQPTTEDVLVKVNSSPATIVVQPEISNSVYIGKDSKYSNYWSSTTTEKSKFRYVTTNIFSTLQTSSTTVPSIVTPEQSTESTTKLIFRWKPVVSNNLKSDTNEAEDAPTTGKHIDVDATSPVTVTQSQLSPLPTTEAFKTSVDPITQVTASTTMSPVLNTTGQSISNNISSPKNVISQPTNLPNISQPTTTLPAININVKQSETTQRQTITTTTKKSVPPLTVKVSVTTPQQYLIPTSTTTTPTFGIRSLISRVLGNGGINAASIQAKSKASLETSTVPAAQKEITNSLTKAVSDDIDNLRLNFSTSTVSLKSADAEKLLNTLTTLKAPTGNTQTQTSKPQNSNIVSADKQKQVTTMKPKTTPKSEAPSQKSSTTLIPKISSPPITTAKPLTTAKPVTIPKPPTTSKPLTRSKPVSTSSTRAPLKTTTTQKSTTSVKPSTTQKPVTTTKPTSTPKPVTTTKLSSTQKPTTATKPTTQKPITTTKKVATTQKVTTTQKPVTSQSTTTTYKPTSNKIVTDPYYLTTTKPVQNQKSHVTVEPINSLTTYNSSHNTLPDENVLTNLYKPQEITAYDEQFFRSILQQNNKGVVSSGQHVVELANKVIEHASQTMRASTTQSVIPPANYANTGGTAIVRDPKKFQIADQNEALASKVIEIAVQRATSTASPSIGKHHLTLDLLGQQSSNIKPVDLNDAIMLPSETSTRDTTSKSKMKDYIPSEGQPSTEQPQKPTPNKNQEDQLLAALLGNPLGTDTQKKTSTRSRLSPEEQLLATLIRTQASATGSSQKSNKPAISKQEEQLLAALLNSPAKSSPKPIPQVTTPKPKRLLSDEQILAGLLTGSTPSSPLDQARLVELLSGGRHRTKPTTTTTTAVPRGLGFLLGRFRDPNLLSSSVLQSPNESIDPVSETNNDSVDGPRDTREQSNLVKAAIEVTKAVSQFMGAVIQGATRSFQSFFRSGTSLLSNYFAAGSAQAGAL